MSGDGGTPSIDFEPDLPNNAAEAQAMKDSDDEHPAENTDNWAKAEHDTPSILDILFGGKK